MPAEPTQKPRAKPGNPYERTKQKEKVPTHKSSAQPPKQTSRPHLTTGDWLIVFKHVDDHPSHRHADIVAHFANRKEGALLFTQPTLSRKLASRAKIEQRANENPNALSSKKSRVVTRPDVERAVVAWYQKMQLRGETVTGATLMEKRKRIENLMDVPEDQCLKGEGWLRSFCKAWKIQEIRWHGEAGSVDLVAVEKERIRLHGITAKYAMWDRWNIDESGLVIFAIPDRTLSSGPMSGRKQDKFRITVCFAVNSDGSEQMPVIFIGKSKQPRCFKKKKLTAMGFYYRNNKKAWMTSELFMEWVKMFDLKMRREMRQVLLTLDNFRGHSIAYTPRNMKLEFFEPNMTLYVQPLDAGIIRCFKAHYRSAVCIRALDLDDLGEAEIFKLDLLEAMTIVHDAWAKVSGETIANCWKHTGIMPEDAPESKPTTPSNNSQDTPLLKSAWNLVREFASTDKYTLLGIEQALQDLLGKQYADADWCPALVAIMNAENDVSKALEAVNRLAPSSQSKANAPPTQIAPVQQLQTAETALKDHLVKLKQRNRMFGPTPTIEEMVNPIAEEYDEDLEEMPTDEEIIAAVKHDIAVENGEIIVIDDDDDEEEGEEEQTLITTMEGFELIQKLEAFCVSQGDQAGLVPQLRKLRGELFKEMHGKLTQKPLTAFWDNDNDVEMD